MHETNEPLQEVVVMEIPSIYTAYAEVLADQEKLKDERDRLQYLLAEYRCDVGRNEEFIASGRKTICTLRGELETCQSENRVAQNALDRLAIARDRCDEPDARSRQATEEADEHMDSVMGNICKCRDEIEMSTAKHSAKNRKITNLEADVQKLTVENSSLLTANGELATRLDKVDKLDDTKDKELKAAKQCLFDCKERVDANVHTLREQRAEIADKERATMVHCEEIRTLKIKNDALLCKLNAAESTVEIQEIEVSMRRADSRMLVRVTELFEEFDAQGGLLATRDLRLARKLLAGHACCPITPVPPVHETIATAKRIMADAISLMEAKNADYGDSWRMMRTPSITDQILVKVHRIRSIEESEDAPRVSEGIESEYRDILNYCVFAMIQIQERTEEAEDAVSPAISECKRVPWVGTI